MQNLELEVAEIRKVLSTIDSAQKKVTRQGEKHNAIVEIMQNGRANAEDAIAKGDIAKYDEWSRALVKAHKDIQTARDAYDESLVELDSAYQEMKELAQPLFDEPTETAGENDNPEEEAE